MAEACLAHVLFLCFASLNERHNSSFQNSVLPLILIYLFFSHGNLPGLPLILIYLLYCTTPVLSVI
jgi:hypothetical protein